MHILNLLWFLQIDTTAAAVDSVLTASKAIGTFGDFLVAIFPGLSAGSAALVAQLVCSLPIIATLLANEWVGKWLHCISPFVETYLAPIWAKVKFLANPVIGMLLGHAFFGRAIEGLIAGGVFSSAAAGVKALGGKTPEGIKRASAIVLVLGAMLCASSAAHADDTFYVKKPVTLMSQLVPAIGTGVRLEQGSDHAVSWIGAQLGFTPFNHIAIRPLVRRMLDGRAHPWEGEAGLWLVF